MGVALLLVGVASVTVVVIVFVCCNNGWDVDGCECTCAGVRGGDGVCVVEGDANSLVTSCSIQVEVVGELTASGIHSRAVSFT